MRNLVYISFSTRDNALRMQLRQALLGDVRLHDLVWDDMLITVGASVEDAVAEHVAQARVMIMLVSGSYLDPGCGAWKCEIPQAIAAQDAGELTILWLSVEEVDRADTPFAGLQSALPLSRPLAAMSDDERDVAFDEVRKQVRGLVGLDHSGQFDVFLSHNSRDKPQTRELRRALDRRGLTSWMDEEQLRPGVPWQALLEDGIRRSASVAVLVGGAGLGPWEDQEMQAALQLAVRDKRPVIPVILPGAAAQPQLPLFLTNLMWVDLRVGEYEDGITRVVWGITGDPRHVPTPPKPAPRPPPIDPPNPPMPRVRLPIVIAAAGVALVSLLAGLAWFFRPELRCAYTVEGNPDEAVGRIRAALENVTPKGGLAGSVNVVTTWKAAQGTLSASQEVTVDGAPIAACSRHMTSPSLSSAQEDKVKRIAGDPRDACIDAVVLRTRDNCAR